MARPRAPWWMYLLAASFLAYFALVTYSTIWGVQHLGIYPAYTSGRMLLREVDPDGPAGRAGVHPGDVVVAVNGVPLHSRVDWMAMGANFEAGRPQRLEIERAGKRLEVSLTLRQQSWSDLDPGARTVFPALRGAQLALFILALVLAFSRPFDRVAGVGALFLAGAGTAWIDIPYGMGATMRHLPVLLAGLIWIAEVGAVVSAPMLFTFFAIFPRVLFRARWAWFLAWLPGAVSASAYLLFNYRAVYQPGSALRAPGWTLPAVLAVAAFYVLGGLVELVINYGRLEDINERRRLRVLVVGSVVGWLALLPATLLDTLGITSGILPSFLLSVPVLMIAVLLFMAFPISFGYAILRYRLFDIRLIVRQGLQYALARGVLLSVVPALGAILVLDLAVHSAQPLAAILAARGWVYLLLGGLAFTAHARRQQWLEALDRRFFRERYDAQRLLREVVEEVRGAGSFERVAPRVVARIEAALHPEFVALLLREPREVNYRSLASAPSGQAPPPLPAESKLMALLRVLGKPLEVSLTQSGWLKQQLPHEETDFLRQARIDLLVPIAVDPERREALLALGVKRSEEPYTREDQDLLVAIATSLALLLEKPVAPGFSPPGAALKGGATATPSEALEECPQCGTCYDTGVGRCAQEGASLVPMHLPRLLAGRYRLERRRGRGGMGAVYEALDTALERRVAVKVIRDELLGSTQAAERFRREARAAASFTHPNVVTVYDFGVAADTRAFLVMELLEGSSLREELQKNKRLPAQRLVEILRGVFAAVEAAHRRQLIHRDLKPENIFLARSETGEVPKVLDFGIAKFLPAATQATADTDSTVLVGTPRYMAPEQLRGQGVSTGWDLWALAVVAYEMLTGAPPFASATAAECHAAVLAGRFAPLTRNLPDAPARWQEFFSRAFCLNPSDRPKSAQTFFAELERSLR